MFLNSNGADEESNETAGEPEKKENVKEIDTQEPEKRIRRKLLENGDKSENPASEPRKVQRRKIRRMKQETRQKQRTRQTSRKKSHKQALGAGRQREKQVPQKKRTVSRMQIRAQKRKRMILQAAKQGRGAGIAIGSF
ncbi:MAG: hypothetical protein ACLR8P_02620 [Clostridium fessum]